MKRALATFNYLAVAVAVFAVFAAMLNWFPANPSWDSLIFIPVGLFFFACIALPFLFMLGLLRDNKFDEVARIMTALVNLVFCIVAGFEVRDIMEGRSSDPMEIFCMGFAALALANALYSMFGKQSAQAH